MVLGATAGAVLPYFAVPATAVLIGTFVGGFVWGVSDTAEPLN